MASNRTLALLRQCRRNLCSGRGAEISSIPKVSTGDSAYASNPGANIHWINAERHSQLGPIYAEDLGPDVSVVYVADPDMSMKILRSDGDFPNHVVPRAWEVFNEREGVKRGLFFAQGPEWQRLRQMLNPIMLKKGQNLGEKSSHVSATDELVNSLRNELFEQGEAVTIPNLEAKLHAWSVETVLRILFGTSYDNINKNWQKDVFIHSTKEIFKESARLQFLDSEQEAAANTPLWRRFSEATATSLRLAYEVTDAALKDQSDGLAGQMMKMTTLEEIKRLVADLIIAAADTTSTTALWTLHLLAEAPGEQQRVCAEDRYTSWCLKESMRLYPVAPFITRILSREIAVGDEKSFVLPKDTLVLLSTFAMGRDERFFPQPNQFWPGRWQRSASSAGLVGVTTPYAVLPFGHGIRSCIGKVVAMNQLDYLIKSFVGYFEMRSLNETKVEMTMKMTGCPDQDIRIGITERVDKS